MFKTSTTTNEIAKALFEAQKKMGVVTKSAENPYFKSKYADLNSILDVVTEPLEAEGILLIQPTTTDGTSNFVTTRLQHVKTGEFYESTVKLELSKVTMQELGSAVSYARRYTLQSLVRLQSEDDDGNLASKKAATEAAGTVRKSSFKKEPVVAVVQEVPTVTRNNDTW